MQSDTVLSLGSLLSINIILLHDNLQRAVLYNRICSFELLVSSFVSVVLQKEVPKVIRQGFDEMLQYEKKTEEKKTRVYSYENAVERCYTFLFMVFKKNY